MAVACSGGRDSIALLHATMRAAQPLGLQVLPLHVHHGLLPEADGWQQRLRQRCARWRREGWPLLPLAVTRLAGAPGPGESLEAWARLHRYRALDAMAQAGGADLVLLAQHQDDQAETVLLQALRQAGPAGLAAMPALRWRDGRCWARPWLAQPGSAIAAYLHRHRLRAESDPSNADPTLARARLRHEVMPALRQAFPQAPEALAEVARRAHEARSLMDEVADEDLARMGVGAAPGSPLPQAAWRALSAPRQANALRAWLSRQQAGGWPERLVQRVLAEWQGPQPRQWPAPAGARLAASQGVLHWRPPAPGTLSAGVPTAGPPVWPARWLDGAHVAPPPGWSGHWVLERSAAGQGVSTDLLPGLHAAPRQGGEQFRLSERGTARALKKQFQARRVPLWERQGPLLFTEAGALAWVPGLGWDAGLQAGHPGPWCLRWCPAAAASAGA